MTQPSKPPLAAKLRAAFAGERDTGTLEALRSAGRAAYDELMAAEQVREDQVVDQVTPWAATQAVSSQLLAAWNGFVLQTLGEALLDADYAADKATVGFVPEVTHGQAYVWLSEVPEWIARARQARADPGYDLTADIDLPLRLPAWVVVESLPAEHVTAMMSAAPALRARVDAALYALERTNVTEEQTQAVNWLKKLASQAAAAADYAGALHSAGRDANLSGTTETNFKRALETWFYVGQLAAMPRLLASRPWEASAQTGTGTDTAGSITGALQTATAMVESATKLGANPTMDISIKVDKETIELHIHSCKVPANDRRALLAVYARVLNTHPIESPFDGGRTQLEATGTFGTYRVKIWTLLEGKDRPK
ncbi:hypothetical protein [Acrocarpospora sp. B8E8]|uniref:hypothetical protein n=1 Tax=Acrocarpospora sp. B8E8 TaxID=3153572 RepID=UPI00325CB0D6